MPPRLRKLVGTVLLVFLVVVWALLAMAFAQSRIREAAAAWQMLYYVVAGLGWVIPAALVIRWMERPRT